MKSADEIGPTPDVASDGDPSRGAPQLAGTTTFAAKAKDLESLRNAVVDAAGVGAGLWLSYLFVLFYLAIAVGSVTHRDLLFESAVKLPFLNVDLPLAGFFILGPALFLIVHAYVLLHFMLLADKIGVFHAELQAQIADADACARLRRQLPSNIFVQILAGPPEMRTGFLGFMLRLIAQITLVAAPLALLLLFQFHFLPYHDEAITWWHRCSVLADLALLWTLWPSVARGEISWLAWRDLRRRAVAVAALASLTTVLLVLTIAILPDEWPQSNLPTVQFVPTQWPTWSPEDAKGNPPVKHRRAETALNDKKEKSEKIGIFARMRGVAASMGWSSPYELLFLGRVDLIARKPTSVWSNRLVLPGINLVDGSIQEAENRSTARPKTLSLRGRRLEGIVLIGATLTNMDFSAARLQGAVFNHADLRKVKFACEAANANIDGEDSRSVDGDESQVTCVQLQKASFDGADLREVRFGCDEDDLGVNETPPLYLTSKCARLMGASFRGAQMQGASLRRAPLQRARFDGAHLQFARLDGADLRGASFEDEAELQGAVFYKARLRDASFVGAKLYGASLAKAELQRASFEEAYLYGASLRGAQLQGASLHYAQLNGAVLDNARLAGADLGWALLSDASLAGAGLQGANLGRVEFHGAFLENTGVWRADPENSETYRQIFVSSPNLTALSAGSFTRLKRLLGEEISILDPDKPQHEESRIAACWTELAASSPARDVYENNLAVELNRLGCAADGAPYVIHGLTRRLMSRFRSNTKLAAAIAAAFLDEGACPGARGLSEKDKMRLRRIRNSSQWVPLGEKIDTPKRDRAEKICSQSTAVAPKPVPPPPRPLNPAGPGQ